jgi:hypothetical protein
MWTPITIVILLGEAVTFASYSVFAALEIHRRYKAPHSSDVKMRTYGRTITWVVIFLGPITKAMTNETLYAVAVAVILVCYIAGLRLWINSYKTQNETKASNYRVLDQWLVRIYRKYLEPLGK